MLLNQNIFSLIKKHALENAHEECCGFVLNDNIFKTKNYADNKAHSFVINPVDFLSATKKGKIIGFYHSHCYDDVEFSELDKINSFHNKLPLILYHILTDKFKIYEDFNKLESKFNKYIGIKFQYNINDCFSLVKDFYKNELNISLPHITRDSNWFIDTPNLINDNIENFGFVKTKPPLKYGDIVVNHNNLSKFPRHLMIYLGNNQILHNKLNGYSIIELYDPYKLYTSYVMRHKLLC